MKVRGGDAAFGCCVIPAGGGIFCRFAQEKNRVAGKYLHNANLNALCALKGASTGAFAAAAAASHSSVCVLGLWMWFFVCVYLLLSLIWF